MRFLLIHSPFVGAMTWGQVGEVLSRWGHDVSIPSLVQGLARESNFHEGLIDLAVRDAPTFPWVIGHSGAGQLLPGVASQTDVDGLIYVDSALPHPGLSRLDSMPVTLADRLTGLRTGESVTAWPSWFDPSTLSELVTNEELMQSFIDDCPRLPWKLLTEPIPDSRWLDHRSRYLQFSDGYASEVEKAALHGWTVKSLDGHHLWPLDHPEETAQAIVNLAS